MLLKTQILNSQHLFLSKKLRSLNAIQLLKLASVDLNNHILIQQAAETGLPLISTGFSSKQDILDSLDFLDSINCSNFSILHCVSVYPAPTDIMNLKYIETIQSMTNKPVGLSDHSDTPIAAIVATGMGIELIEKHTHLTEIKRALIMLIR